MVQKRQRVGGGAGVGGVGAGGGGQSSAWVPKPNGADRLQIDKT